MKQNAELLRKSITVGVSGIVYDCIPPIRVLKFFIDNFFTERMKNFCFFSSY